MSNSPHSVITESAHLTLHYRLASERGEDIVSTFGGNPATLQLGTGQLAPFLETCMLGLGERTHHTFVLAPEQAFGARNPKLLQRMSRDMLNRNSNKGKNYAIGDLVRFAAPGSGQFAGVLREIEDDSVLFDFNHPLAGQSLQFEVKIIGIL